MLPLDDQSINEDFKKLYEAAVKNDWNTAYKDIFKGDPSKNSKYLKAKISDKGDTALHIAVATESSMFVRKLVYHMKKEDLTIKNGDDSTAFCLVAASGSVELAKVMFTKNEELLRIRGAENMLPIHITAKHGHEKMMEFLLGVTKEKLAEEDDTKLKDLINKTDLSGKHTLVLMVTRSL
ncbi:hypothetical protein Pint_11201 [Pistacia integerrima]|uniref:Uncharacterized protein n=1 Tax=Pistacia integerrima TaxID=434235 RepID=A0ACC0XLP6_9ROSI|nr:hypothetical protein Pint_11201 [Pistacia integerrima]